MKTFTFFPYPWLGVKPLRYACLCTVVLLALENMVQCAASNAATNQDLPAFPEVQKLVVSYFATLPNYGAGDLISRDQVRPVLKELKQLGWDVADADQILALVPGDDDLFVRKLRATAAGRKFMRQSAKYPLVFDRIDRLSRLPRADQNIQSLIDGPDGYKMLQYMTETVYGTNLGIQLSHGPNGANFNAPTGRLYTVEALLGRLEQSYNAELISRAQSPQPTR